MKNMTIQFTDEQNRAIDQMVEWYGAPERTEFYLAGFAGVGKSTVCAEAISRIKSTYKIVSVPTAAYTGKAAHVLRKKGNFNAQTIHSMIYKCEQDPEDGSLHFVLNPIGAAALADLIVLDECSMIDNQMADDLSSFGKKILVMGDPGQLPPINGQGRFTAREPDIFLKEIHRQAADSPIIELATMARQGIHLPVGYNKNGVKVLQLTNENAEAIHDPNTQVICGLNRIRWSVTQLMRARLGYEGELPLKGERIICKKNNKDRGLFNGALGTLHKLEVMESGAWKIDGEIEGSFQKALNSDPFLFKQHFDNGATQRDWKKKRPNEFDWGYIITCHSAQGSSWPHCTIIDDSASFREDSNKWKYTALTRAEEGLTILVK